MLTYDLLSIVYHVITIVKNQVSKHFQKITREKTLEKVPIGQLGCLKPVYIPVVFSGGICFFEIVILNIGEM